MFFIPETLTIDSIYHENDNKIFRIDNFYDMPHDKPPKYTVNKYYLSKEKGIFQVDVIDNETNVIYSSR